MCTHAFCRLPMCSLQIVVKNKHRVVVHTSATKNKMALAFKTMFHPGIVILIKDTEGTQETKRENERK